MTNMVISGGDQAVAYVCVVVLAHRAADDDEQARTAIPARKGKSPKRKKLKQEEEDTEVSENDQANGKSGKPALISTRDQLVPPGCEVTAVQGLTKQNGLAKTKCVRYDFSLGRVTKTLSKHKGICTGLDIVTATTTGSSEKYSVVAYTVRRHLYVWDERNDEFQKLEYSKPLTSVAIHPELRFIATGDIEGQIISWFLFEKSQSSSLAWSLRNDFDLSHTGSLTSVRHWHAHACSCLCFTQDGAYMLSGGEEAVLVMWQVNGNNRTFLPRLGAPLLSLGSFLLTEGQGGRLVYTVGLADASCLLVDAASLKGVWHLRYPAVSSCSPFNHRASDLDGMVIDPRTGGVVLNSFAGRPSLQFLSIERETFLGEYEIVARTYISRKEKNTPPKISITHVCFSNDGKRMATIDALEDQHLPKCTLKFWDWNMQQGKYELNTSVENPHGEDRVTCLTYNPCKEAACTGSTKGEFKVWECRACSHSEYSIAEKNVIKDMNSSSSVTHKKSGIDSSKSKTFAPKQSFSWRCKTASSYRENDIHDISVSDDGSVVAVSYGDVITLWEHQQCRLLSVIMTHNGLSTAGEVLHTKSLYTRTGFPQNSATLVAASERQLVTWDLLSGKRLWSYEGDIGPVDFDERGVSGQMGLIAACISSSQSTTRSWSVLLFCARDPCPIFSWKVCSRFEEKPIAVCFVRPKPASRDLDEHKPTTPSVLLTLLTSCGHLYAISTRGNLKPSMYNRLQLPSQHLQGKMKNPWEKSSEDMVSNPFDRDRVDIDNAKALKMLAGPIQSLPPLRILAPKLLDSFIPCKNSDATSIRPHDYHFTSTKPVDDQENQVATVDALNSNANGFMRLFSQMKCDSASAINKRDINSGHKPTHDVCKQIVDFMVSSRSSEHAIPNADQVPQLNGHSGKRTHNEKSRKNKAAGTISSTEKEKRKRKRTS